MKTPLDKLYPLGFVNGAEEMLDFSAEAEAIGIITMLWNRHELQLGDIFASAMGSQHAFARALWDSENTHRGKLKLLRLAVEAAPMTDEQKDLLSALTEQTALVSEKRNALIHGEFVVDMPNDKLIARQSRRLKPPVYHPSDIAALYLIIESISQLDGYVSALRLSFLPPDLIENMRAFADGLKAVSEKAKAGEAKPCDTQIGPPD